jgi:hypothetical protein
VNSNGLRFVPTVGFSEGDNESAFGIHISGQLPDQLGNYQHLRKE